jgi:hypothetical protein
LTALCAAGVPAFAQIFTPGNLVVSRSAYDGNPANVKIGTILPPNCATTLGACGASTGAPYDGSYPTVFNNDLYDGSFGITTKIFLDELTGAGDFIRSVEVPNSAQPWTPKNKRLVTSFSSKSELGLNLTDDGKFVTFMGYVAPLDTLDVSNANTPLAIDPTNPDGQTPAYRAVARVNKFGDFDFTVTNAYSGNNGRAAILNDSTPGHDLYYTAGNAGNGANPQPAGIVAGAGAQIIPFVHGNEVTQDPALPTPVGSFSVTQLGAKADKVGKDDNFRGMTTFNNVLYYTKGSGSNGVNTVYFVDTVGGACPNGVGLPKPGATLPTASIPYSTTTVATTGLASNMCILAGFPSTLNSAKGAVPLYPFGLFFADANTLYVADEGDGYTKDATLYTHAAAQTTAGLQKWVFNSTTKLWALAYTIQTGLGLGTPYNITGYPAGNNPATGLPWSPAAGGLRNIAGLVLPSGVVAIWGITSTVSGNGDVGADPNQLVVAADYIANTDPTKIEGFVPLKTANYGEVLRGVTFTPGTKRSGYTTLP